MNRLKAKPYRAFKLLISMTFFAMIVFKLDTSAAAISACSIKDNGTSNLVSLVKVIRSKKCKVKSVDDLIGKMPKSMRSRHVLMYRSQSLQGPHTIDFQYPRAILATSYKSSAKKRLYLSFNGKPSQANHNNIEVLEIDTTVPKSSEKIFRYFDIKFPSDTLSKNISWEDAQKKIVVSNPNPQKCIACHGSPARPIFQSYPIWKGAYGSSHMNIKPKEKNELEKFVQNIQSDASSRYRHLIFADDPEGIEDKYDLVLDGKNNLDFNVSLSVPNLLRVARVARKTKNYKKYVAATLGASLDCPDFRGFFPDHIKSVIDNNINEAMSLKVKYDDSKIDAMLRSFYNLGFNQFGSMMTMVREKLGMDSIDWSGFSGVQKNFWGDWDIMNKLWLDTVERQGHNRSDVGVAKLRYIYEGRGLDISNWFIDIKQPTYRFSDGNQWSNSLAWAFIADDSYLEKYSDLAQKSNPDSSYYGGQNFNSKEHEKNRLKLCSQLKNDSFFILEKASTIKSLRAKSFDKVIHQGQFPKTFVNTCASCHTNQQVGPSIPFLSAESFKEWYFSGTNRNKIHYRLTTENDLDRMPLNRHLEREELNAILEYLKLIEQ